MASVAVSLLVAGCTADDGDSPPIAADPIDAVLRIELDGCGSIPRKGATAVVSSDLRLATTPAGVALAVTVAHPFIDDAGRLDVEGLRLFDRTGSPVDGTLVWIDAEHDLAVIEIVIVEVTGPMAGLRLGDWLTGDEITMARFEAADQPAELTAVTVVRRVDATLDGRGKRRSLELDGEIEPGDSGAPLINERNEIVGLVFAANRADEGGWAIDASEISSADTSRRTPIPLVCESS